MSDLDLRPTSELDAVNMMLVGIGESPVNTIEDSGVVEAVLALQILKSTSRRVQAKGWYFNIEKGRTLARTLDGEIIVPANCLKVDTVGASEHIDVTSMGTRLYNRRTQSFVFEQDVVVDMTVMRGFDYLPETARQYIMMAAARKFQESVVGSDVLARFNQRDELLAYADLMAEEGENGDYNILSGDYSVARVLDR